MNHYQLPARLFSWAADMFLASAFYLLLALAAIYMLGLQKESYGAIPALTLVTLSLFAMAMLGRRLANRRAAVRNSLPSPKTSEVSRLTQLVLMAVTIALPGIAHAELSVVEAYRAIPHRRMVGSAPQNGAFFASTNSRVRQGFPNRPPRHVPASNEG